MRSIYRMCRATFFALLFISLAISCKEVKKEAVPEEKKTKSEQKKSAPERNGDSAFAFLKDIETKNVPMIEDTNFDNFTEANRLTEAEIKLLRLDKIIEGKNVTGVYLNYNLTMSTDFKSMVISYERGGSELVTLLVNYDENYNLIDYKNIAYDEIEENMFTIDCEIKKNEIVCTETDYSNEEPVMTEKEYAILKNGKIKVKPFLN